MKTPVAVLCALLLVGCIVVKPHPTDQSMDIIMGGVTNTVPISAVSGFSEFLCAITGHPELAAPIGTTVAGLLGFWIWYNRKKKKETVDEP